MIQITKAEYDAARDLRSDLLDDQGGLRIMPASFYAETTALERHKFGRETGRYVLPTIELVDWLKQAIGDKFAIEIGSGWGELAAAVGIQATDSYLQQDPDLIRIYEGTGNATTTYGQNVEKLDAHAAVAKYKPEIVVASWVTQKYDASRHEAGGSMYGVEEDKILDDCQTYIFIGNSQVHAHKPIWKRPNILMSPTWLYSRAINGTPDFIGVWDRVSADVPR